MIPRKIGRYEPVRVLGRGSMGIVYEARDPNLDRSVAIKTIRVDNLAGAVVADYEARFRTEARSVARLQHPHIVSVYDAGRDGDIAFLVMEYVQGEDLKQRLDRGASFTFEQSLRLIRELLAALAYAHQQGILHRDIKPANLLLEADGRVKLTDFGVARIQDSGEATRTQGHMVGTLKYMAPEQVQGLKGDARADLFSAGVLLYQLLTNRRPFDGDNDFSIIQQIVSHDPVPPSAISAGLPVAIDAVVARALAKDPAQRFATAREFASALQSAGRRVSDPALLPPPPVHRAPSSQEGDTRRGVEDGPPTITQELELIYWKDIKESADPTDFEAFLLRFPAGIYSDLARKRLARLADASAGAESTVLTGMGANGLAASAGVEAVALAAQRTAAGRPGAEALYSADEGTEPVADSPSHRSGMSASPGDGDASAQRFAPRSAVGADPSEAGAATSLADAETSPPATVASREPTSSPEPGFKTMTGEEAPPQRKPSTARMAVFAGLSALAIAGAMLYVGQRIDQRAAVSPASSAPGISDTGNMQADSARPEPTRQASAPAPAPSVVAAQGSTATPVPAASVAGPAVRTHASASPVLPARRASAGAVGQAGSTTASGASANIVPPPPEPTRSSERTTPAHREEGPARSAAAAPSTVARSVEACRDRIFIARELCLAETCEKPGARGHPLCVQWRRDKDLRENARLRQGPQ